MNIFQIFFFLLCFWCSWPALGYYINNRNFSDNNHYWRALSRSRSRSRSELSLGLHSRHELEPGNLEISMASWDDHWRWLCLTLWEWTLSQRQRKRRQQRTMKRRATNNEQRKKEENDNDNRDRGGDNNVNWQNGRVTNCRNETKWISCCTIKNA